MPSNDAMTNNQDALVTAAWALAERLSGAEAYLVDRVGLKMTLDRDQEELLVADLGAAARTIITLSEREARKDAALREIVETYERRGRYTTGEGHAECVEIARATLNPPAEQGEGRSSDQSLVNYGSWGRDVPSKDQPQ
jgi:hypothetical protein